MESPFDQINGVIDTTSGYTGGSVANPTYGQVSSGTTGHAESVQVTYDPSQVAYGTLLEVYWHNVDPLDGGGQFCDRGNQYRTAIFYHSPEQESLALASKQALEQEFAPQAIATEIVPATAFYPAEDYHQDYYQKQSLIYKFYRFRCGRDRRLIQLWGQSH
jgi:peptide-methionine (S)-S-oxide reductase